jgi:hypothetical protein
VAAVKAHPEMNPPISSLQAFLAAGDLVWNRQNLNPFKVLALRHGFSLLSSLQDAVQSGMTIPRKTADRQHRCRLFIDPLHSCGLPGTSDQEFFGKHLA